MIFPTVFPQELAGYWLFVASAREGWLWGPCSCASGALARHQDKLGLSWAKVREIIVVAADEI